MPVITTSALSCQEAKPEGMNWKHVFRHFLSLDLQTNCCISLARYTYY